MLSTTQLVGFGAYNAAGGAPTPDILWWKFPDGSGATATAEVGPNCDLAGGYTWVTGKSGSGYAIQSDGSADLISASAVAYGSSIITITAWMYYTSGDAVMCESSSNAFTVDHAFEANVGGSVFYFAQSGTGGSYNLKEITMFAASTWTHVAWVIDNSTTAGSIKVYYDGVLQTPNATSGTKVGSGNLSTQTLYLLSRNGNQYFWNGRVDDFRIYSRELTADEIVLVYAEAA